jgi:hypothetical protein
MGCSQQTVITPLVSEHVLIRRCRFYVRVAFVQRRIKLWGFDARNKGGKTSKKKEEGDFPTGELNGKKNEQI